jgi:hypothetical protein
LSTPTNPERIYQDTDEAIARTISFSHGDLNGSTISGVTWAVPSELTDEAESQTATSATIQLSGGAPGTAYKVVCTVTTAGGETIQQHFLLTITD